MDAHAARDPEDLLASAGAERRAEGQRILERDGVPSRIADRLLDTLRAPETISPERYSFNTYLAGEHGHFKMAIAHAIQKADRENQYRLAAYWPEMVAAYHEPSWADEPLYIDVARCYADRIAPDGYTSARHFRPESQS